MSAPPGYNAETSLLQGGDNAPIQAQQGGGSENISLLQGGEETIIHPQQGGQVNPDTPLTSEQKERVIQAGVLPMVLVQQIEGISPNVAKRAVDIGAAAEIKKIQEETKGREQKNIIADASESEKMAAQKATDLLSETPDFIQKYPTPEAQKKALEDIAFSAIFEERKKRVPQIITTTQYETQLKYGLAASNTVSKLTVLESINIHNEFYTLPETTDNTMTYDLSNINNRLKMIQTDIDKWIKQMINPVSKYKQQRLKLWNSILKNTGNKVSPILPTNNIQQVNKNEIFTQFSRYIHCLPVSTDSIIIIPPIHGDIVTFHKIINRLQKIKAITYTIQDGIENFKVKNNTILVFMPPFFIDIVQTDINMLMFSLFLDLYKNSPNQVFLLSQSSAENYAMGTLLSQKFTSNTNSNSINTSSTTNIIMLEPTYILYPYTRNNISNGLLISGSTNLEKINMPKLNSYSLNDLKYNNIKYGQTMSIAFKPSLLNSEPDGIPFEEGASNIFTIRSYKSDSEYNTTLEQTNTSVLECDGLLTEEPNLFIRSNSFYLDTVNVLPEAADLNSVKAMTVILALRLNPNGKYTVLCKESRNTFQQGGNNHNKHNKHNKEFHHDETAKKDGIYHEQIDLINNLYNLRKHTIDNGVQADWESGKFTRDEADFLNALHLTPQLLNTIFPSEETDEPKKYLVELAQFLKTITLSNCLTDTSLLMNKECLSARVFLEKVNKELLKKNLEHDFADDSNDELAESILHKKVDLDGVHEHADPIDGAKEEFKVLKPYIDVKTEPNTRKSDIIGIHKKTGTYKFYTISVPLTHAKEGGLTSKEAKKIDIQAINKKVNELKIKHPEHIFIY
jgi:hypothetical protein